MDRKDFFSKAFKLAVGKGLEAISENRVVDKLEALAEEKPKKARQRPPGASADDQRFQELCTGCDQCMIACPANVVMIEDMASREPVIFPNESPCLHCQGYPCIDACSTGALSLSNGTDTKGI